MSDLVENPDDRYSHDAANFMVTVKNGACTTLRQTTMKRPELVGETTVITVNIEETE